MSVIKIRTKPVTKEAMYFDGTIGAMQRLSEWTNGMVKMKATGSLTVFTLEGPLTAQSGDYIVKGLRGEFYPIKPDIYEQTYEEITNA